MPNNKHRWLRVEQQCPEQWSEERERRRTVFCDTCGQHVVNLSRLTRKEAKALVESGTITCASYDTTADGTPIFETRRERAVRRLATGGLAFGLAACGTEPASTQTEPAVATHVEPALAQQTSTEQAASQVPAEHASGQHAGDISATQVAETQDANSPETEACDSDIPKIDRELRNIRGAIRRHPPNRDAPKHTQAGDKGTVTLVSAPWSEVFYRGRKIGQTPDRFTLPVGGQKLVLKNPDTGQSKTITVTVEKDKKVTKRVAL